MELYHIPCGTVVVRTDEMFNHLPSERIRCYYRVGATNELRIPMNALLIASGDQAVLIDPGCAEFLPKRFLESYGLNIERPMEEMIARAGFHPEQVTDVIFTHLHFDHGSGAFLREPGRITKRFPKARYHVLKSHYVYARKPHPGESGSFFCTFLKYVDEIHWLEEWPKNHWISFRVFHGHTKWMVVPEILFNGRRVYYLSDLIPMELFLEPDVNSGYDIDPELAVREKVDFLEGLERESELIFFHDPLKNSIIYP
jgi:glyoxylase-like metal-dependent hydrolase (beta-lactamase superfamily II)